MNFSYLDEWLVEAMNKTEGRGIIFKFMFRPPFGMNDIIADLHGHTNSFSDGSRSLEYYKKITRKNNFSKIAITDHDSIGIDDKPEGFINGVEITSLLDDNEVEILVYGYDQELAQSLIDSGEFPYLDKNFKFLRNLELTKKRIDLCNKLKLTSKKLSLGDVLNIEFISEKGELEKLSLSQIGIDATHIISHGGYLPEKVFYNGKYYPIQYGYLISKLFNCIHSDKKGIAFLNSKAESDSSFNPHSPSDFMKMIVANKYGELYIDAKGFWPTVEQCIEFAKKTGGVSILAHPFGYNKKINITTLDLIKKAYHLGIDGIEVFHGFNQSDEVEFLYKFCYEHGLIPTMGSDTHGFISNQGGRVEPGIAPGVGHQQRYFENNVEDEYTSIYNLFYYGTGAWRGEETFDYLSVPPSIQSVLKSQLKSINKNKLLNKKKSVTKTPEPMAQ